MIACMLYYDVISSAKIEMPSYRHLTPLTMADLVYGGLSRWLRVQGLVKATCRTGTFRCDRSGGLSRSTAYEIGLHWQQVHPSMESDLSKHWRPTKVLFIGVVSRGYLRMHGRFCGGQAISLLVSPISIIITTYFTSEWPPLLQFRGIKLIVFSEGDTRLYIYTQ